MTPTDHTPALTPSRMSETVSPTFTAFFTLGTSSAFRFSKIM